MWTPIPESAAEYLKSWFFSTTVKLALWRIFLLAALALVVYPFAAASLPGFLLAALITFMLARFWGDEIKQIAVDLWNLEFYRV